MAVLGCLLKLKRGLGLALGAYFLHGFSLKMFFILYFINGQNFNVIPFFPFQDIKQNVSLSSYLDS